MIYWYCHAKMFKMYWESWSPTRIFCLFLFFLPSSFFTKSVCRHGKCTKLLFSNGCLCRVMNYSFILLPKYFLIFLFFWSSGFFFFLIDGIIRNISANCFFSPNILLPSLSISTDLLCFFNCWIHCMVFCVGCSTIIQSLPSCWIFRSFAVSLLQTVCAD